MPIKALLGIGTAVAGMTLLAWPAPREEKPRDAILIVRGGAPSSPVDAWIGPAAVDARGPVPVGAANHAHYAWEARAAADDDAPGDPRIWATPAEFAAPE